MGEEKTSNYTKVSVEPEAFVSMLLHARQHAYQAVHGVLLGSAPQQQGSTLTIKAAVPVCHGTPVQPWIETSLSLIEAQLEDKEEIVGWYTAPLLLQDSRPGPVALRMASILDDASSCSSTLIVLNNQAAANCCQGNVNQVPAALQAFGKDFGNQYQEKIPTMVGKLTTRRQTLPSARTCSRVQRHSTMLGITQSRFNGSNGVQLQTRNFKR